MKKQVLKSALVAVVGIGLMAGSALATISGCDNDCCDTDCQLGVKTNFSAIDNLNPDKKISNGQSYSSSFNLNSYSATTWDINSEDLISSAKLEFSLYDDAWPNDGIFGEKEFAKFVYDGTTKTWESYGILTDWTPTFNVIGSLLGTDHTLSFTITGTGGDFYIDKISVYGTFCDVTAVPEPTTMFLFGTGIIGLAAISRRRKES